MQIERDGFTVLYVQQDERAGIVHDGKESSGILQEKIDFIGAEDVREHVPTVYGGGVRGVGDWNVGPPLARGVRIAVERWKLERGFRASGAGGRRGVGGGR
jgi:hypothetical protein